MNGGVRCLNPHCKAFTQVKEACVIPPYCPTCGFPKMQILGLDLSPAREPTPRNETAAPTEDLERELYPTGPGQIIPPEESY